MVPRNRYIQVMTRVGFVYRSAMSLPYDDYHQPRDHARVGHNTRSTFVQTMTIISLFTFVLRQCAACVTKNT